MDGFTRVSFDYDSPYGEIEKASTVVSAHVKITGKNFEYKDFKVETVMGCILEDVTRAFSDQYPSRYHTWFERQLMERILTYVPPHRFDVDDDSAFCFLP
jgi:hypothetical protein